MAVSSIIFIAGVNGYYDLSDADDTIANDLAKTLPARWTIRWSKTQAAGALNGTIFTHKHTYTSLPTALRRLGELAKSKDKYPWVA